MAAYFESENLKGFANWMKVQAKEEVEHAISKNDHATKSLLNWFVDEQVEEEASANETLEMLKRVKDSPNALFMLDSRLGGRK